MCIRDRPLTEGSTTGDGVRCLAAEGGAQLRIDQFVERLVFESERDSGFSAVESGAVGDRGFGRGVKDLSLAVGLCAKAGRVVDLLENAWHREDERRLELTQMVHEVHDVGSMAQLGSTADRTDLDDACEYVSQRQKQERGRVVRLEEIAKYVKGPAEERRWGQGR